MAEMRAAAKEPLDYAVAFKASKLSEGEWERVKGYDEWKQNGFEVWLAGKATLVDAISGHIRLAVACSELWRENDYARQWGVFHAGASGDSGVKEMIWERQGRRWEWMVGHPSGFVVAGRELVALGHERVGRVLMQYGGYGEKLMGMRLALYGGKEMEGEVRDVIGIEPYGGGGMIDEALEVQFVGHERPVYCVGDAGGGRIVTGGSNMTVKVWDVHSGKCLMTLDGHTHWVNALVVVGGRVISGSTDQTLRVWDLESGECQQVIEQAGWVCGLCMVNDSTLVSSGDVGAVFVWKVGEDGQLKKEKKELKGHSGQVKCVIALGGSRVASGGWDEVILVHDVESGDVVGKLKGHSGLVNDLAALGDGRLVSASYDETLRVWSSKYTEEAEMVLEGHESRVSSVTVLENGMIVSGDMSGCLRLWSVEGSSWKALGVIKATGGVINGLQALDGDLFASGCADGHVSVLNASRFDGEKQQLGHKSSVWCGAALSDGRIVSGGNNGEIVVWKRADRGKEATVEQAIEGHGRAVRDLVATSNGFAWRDGRSTFLWLEDGTEPFGLEFLSTRLCTVGEGLILVGLEDDKVHCYDLEEKKLLRTVVLGDRVSCITPLDSKGVAAGGSNGRLHVVNVTNGAIENDVTIGANYLQSIVCAGGGKLIVVNVSGELWFWDGKAAPEKLLDGVRWVYTSIGEGRVILNTTDGEMILWNWMTKEREVEFGGLNGRDVADVAWDARRRLAVFFMEHESWIAYEI